MGTTFGDGITRRYDSGYYKISPVNKKLLELTQDGDTVWLFGGEPCNSTLLILEPYEYLEGYVPKEAFAEITFYDWEESDNYVQGDHTNIIMARYVSGGGVPL